MTDDQSTITSLFIATLAVALGSCMDASVKYLAQDTALLHIVAWRYGFGSVIACTAYLIPKKGEDGTRARRGIPAKSTFFFQTIRGFLVVSTAYLFFYGVTLLPLALATTLGFTAALMVPFFAWPVLKETPSLFTCLVSLIGLAGAALAASGQDPAQPSEQSMASTGVTVCLLAAACYAGVLVLLRLRSAQDDPATSSLFTNVVPAIILVPISLWHGALSLAPATILAMMAIGCLGYGLWYLMAIAYARAPAQQLAPLEYTSLIWAALLGGLVFKEYPTWQLWAGGAMIIGACLAVAAQSRYVTRRAARMPVSDLPD